MLFAKKSSLLSSFLPWFNYSSCARDSCSSTFSFSSSDYNLNVVPLLECLWSDKLLPNASSKNPDSSLTLSSYSSDSSDTNFKYESSISSFFSYPSTVYFSSGMAGVF